MIKHDYKPQNNKRFFDKGFFDHIPAWATHPFMIFSMALLVMALAFLLSSENTAEDNTVSNYADVETGEITIQAPDKAIERTPVVDVNHKIKDIDYSDPIDIPLQLESTLIAEGELEPLDIERKWKTETVKKGDNLSLIFKRIGLSAQMVHKIINLDKNSSRLTKLKPGEVLHYQLNSKGQLEGIKYIIDLQQTLFIEKSAAGEQSYSSRIANKTIEYRTAYVDGVITDSLYMSGKRAGLSDTLVVNLANIFDWDIDFILDIRSGDSFSVLYQEKYLDGEKIGNGDIIAAEFINQGDSYQAVRYTDSNNVSNYYTPQGLSMRKAFLRAPIKFSYISSGFKPRRFHPILKRWKAHRGIDYRAKTGTPIRAAGDGKVTHSTSNKYNGKYVFIQHGQGIVTKYLHMSRRAVSRGKRVKQGQVIGYVGATGLAEAPHLHYEFLVNGVHRNPRTVKLPKAEPISKKERTAFAANSSELINQLMSRKQIQSNTQVAK